MKRMDSMTPVRTACIAALLLSQAVRAAAPQLPEPTFRIDFEQTVVPTFAAGVEAHPSLQTEGVQYTDGHSGKAVLLGQDPILVYQAHGNIPDTATLCFWIKPLNWESLREWRKLVTITPGGRAGMMFAHYPHKPPVIQFRWSQSYGGPGHTATEDPLVMNEWNHVAIAWDAFRSRIYFNGKLTLSVNHPSGFHPTIGSRTTLHFGGIQLETSARASFARNVWGRADTALDEFTVYPAMLDAAQIAALAGSADTASAAAELKGPADAPQVLSIPKLTRKPGLDGRLEADEWQEATTLPVLIDAGRPANSFDYPKQRFHFGYDAENLYVAMQCSFPVGAQIPKGGRRESLAEPDVEVFGDESVEFWLFTADEARYRFAGNPAGGFTEMLGKETKWDGLWQYATSMTMTVYGNEVWEMELAVPFKTIGIAEPDGAELKMNICRTWRSLERLGLTNWVGYTNYPLTQYFGQVRLLPSAPGCGVDYTGDPGAGRVKYTFSFTNSGATPVDATLELFLEAALKSRRRQVARTPVSLPPGDSTSVDVDVEIDDPLFQRLTYQLTAKGQQQPLLRYSVPFELRTDFLDVIPLNLQHQVVLRPACSLLIARLRSTGVTEPAVELRVLAPDGSEVATRRAAEDGDIRVDLPEDGPWGEYRVELTGLGADGKAVLKNEKRFERPPTPDWASEPDDVLDRVLPPFTALETQAGAENEVTIRCWGRAYHYRSSLVPVAVETGGIEDILQGPMSLQVDGKPVSAAAVTVTSHSEVRDELVASVSDDRITIRNELWIEYDGLIWNELEIQATTDCRDLRLVVPLQCEYAQYTHCTASMMSLGGGMTLPLDKPLATKYWPVIWIGDFERGLCFFTEGSSDLQTSQREPITVSRDGDATCLTVHLVDRLAAGAKAAIRFGLLATPVKPQHPRYPLNIFAFQSALYEQPPAVPLYSSVTWTAYRWFLDMPYLSRTLGKVVRPDEQLAAQLRETQTKLIPYFTPYTLPSDDAAATHYLREWELLPAQHRQLSQKEMTSRAPPNPEAAPIKELWLSPGSTSFSRYFAHRVGDLIKRTGIDGLYFDFACAMRDGNRYHGADGGYCILGLRDFYRRMANEFVKAGVTDYVIVGHNSESVQIPSLTFLTHFFNGEHHRAKSGTTLHDGKDYLDTLPLYYFGIEHSGLPWGIHGNMLPELPEAKSLIEALGVKDETVSEYLWNRTSSVVMPILLHGCLPGGIRVSHPYFKSVVAVLHQFDIPTATFHPYWRNADTIRADNADIRVSAYARPDAPRVLLVVGNLAKQPREAWIELDMAELYDGWNSSPLTGMKRVEKKDEILQAVERMGCRDARLLALEPKRLRLWVRGHGMALVEVTGHERVR